MKVFYKNFKLIRFCYICFLFLLWFPPINENGISSNIHYYMKIIGLIISIVIELFNGFKKRYLLIWFYAILLCLVTFINNIGQILPGLSYSLTIISLFYFFKNPKNIEYAHYFLYPASFYLAMVIASMLRFQGIPSAELSNKLGYFLGGKFKVGYIGFLWQFLYFMYKNKKGENIQNKEIFICFIVVFLMNIKVNCVSGIICSLILILVLIFRNKIIYFISPNNIFNATLLMNFFTIFIYHRLIDIPIIKHFFHNILKRKSNLTGRTKIYSQFFPALKDDIVLGGGYNNKLIKQRIDFGNNAQNGFLHELCRTGILGIILIMTVIYFSFSFSFHKIKEKKDIYIIAWMFLFVFIIQALIEISFNTYFLFILAFCFACDKNLEKNID